MSARGINNCYVTYTVVNTVQVVCELFNTGLGCFRFAGHSVIAGSQLFHEGSTLLGLAAFLLDALHGVLNHHLTFY